MSTKALIGRELENGMVEFVPVNHDGYIIYTGLILKTFWSDHARLDKLIRHGTISSLGLHMGSKHQGQEWPPQRDHLDDTTFLIRDRDREPNDCLPRTVTRDEFFTTDPETFTEFHFRYLFGQDNSWSVFERAHSNSVPDEIGLDDAIGNLKVVLHIDSRVEGCLWVDANLSLNSDSYPLRDVMNFLDTVSPNWEWYLTKHQPTATIRCGNDNAIVATKLRFDTGTVPEELYDPLQLGID